VSDCQKENSALQRDLKLAADKETVLAGKSNEDAESFRAKVSELEVKMAAAVAEKEHTIETLSGQLSQLQQRWVDLGSML
jgi:hypothetical protein